jgi:hypothetical protein
MTFGKWAEVREHVLEIQLIERNYVHEFWGVTRPSQREKRADNYA